MKVPEDITKKCISIGSSDAGCGVSDDKVAGIGMTKLEYFLATLIMFWYVSVGITAPSLGGVAGAR